MMLCQKLSATVSYNVFYVFHPVHVFMSALVTSSMYGLHQCGKIGGRCFMGKCNLWLLLLVGYTGSVGIATLSDSLIPYLGEVMLDMPNRGAHIGFIEKWWLVNPLAVLGIAVACWKPSTKVPHFAHVLLSTWASLFHIMMAVGGRLDFLSYALVFIFLFIAVWLPCCVSDIVFPMLFIRSGRAEGRYGK
ncbi:MAG: hypothetical protein JW803_01775 [Endomicrobiales bacterium]|nr:hypothetical protein [Endomicrobiales bacterium]